MRRHYLHGPSFQGEGFAPSRPLASSDRRTADGHIGSVLCVSGFSGLEKLPSSRPGFLQQSTAHAGSGRLLQPGPGFGAAQHSACRRQCSPPKPSPAQSIGASGRKSGTPEPREPRPDGGQKPPLHPPGTPHGSGTAAPPVRRESRQV